jgi:REP element-mobilizing transposase RayT
MTVPYRKRVRLDRDLYSEPGSVWFATADTRNLRPVFAKPASADYAVTVLRDQAPKRGVSLLLYCVMPEHIHVLAVIESGDLIAYVGAVKSILANAWNARGHDGKLWQRSFHDSGVRRAEDMDELISYILQNPVKAGLVAEWQEYRWIGGTLIESVE